MDAIKQTDRNSRKQMDLVALLKANAVILDVRTNHEYIGGHIEGAINIPFEDLDLFCDEINSWDAPVLVCCTFGLKSEKAVRLLRLCGVEAYDAGAWRTLQDIKQVFNT